MIYFRVSKKVTNIYCIEYTSLDHIISYIATVSLPKSSKSHLLIQLITTFLLKSNFCELWAKIICYRSYKNFDECQFLSDVNKASVMLVSANPSESYDQITNKFLAVVNKNVPLKMKTRRENEYSFMNKEPSKEIYAHSRIISNDFFEI